MYNVLVYELVKIIQVRFASTGYGKLQILHYSIRCNKHYTIFIVN
jgi:hypothetical protein